MAMQRGDRGPGVQWLRPSLNEWRTDGTAIVDGTRGGI